VAVEVATNKVVYFLFGEGVQVLELVEGAELLDTQAVPRSPASLSQLNLCVRGNSS